MIEQTGVLCGVLLGMVAFVSLELLVLIHASSPRFLAESGTRVNVAVKLPGAGSLLINKRICSSVNSIEAPRASFGAHNIAVWSERLASGLQMPLSHRSLEIYKSSGIPISFSFRAATSS